jgi:hypothetical protein
VQLLHLASHVDAGKLAKLYKKGLQTATLRKYLIDDAPAVIGIDDLVTASGSATAAELETLLQHTFPLSDLTTVITTYTAASASKVLPTYDNYPHYHDRCRALIVMAANAQKASWDPGTFSDAVWSILYHYRKHVIDEGGAAADPAAYTADAAALWANRAAHAQTPEGDVTFVGGHGQPGGRYKTATGAIVTYWYL